MSDWIDVTRVLVDGAQGWPGDPSFQLRRVADIEHDGAMVTAISTSVHIGTHLDAPLHCLVDGSDIASIPLRQLCGPAVVVEASGRAEVTPADLQGADIRLGDRVLLRVAGEDDQAPWAAVSIEAAQWLLERGVVLLGLESPSPDLADAHDLPVHHILLRAGVPILENLDLRKVVAGRYQMIALPLPIKGCEASPARVILRAEGR